MLLNVNVSGRKTVIIGGGKVASRKAESLLQAGAEVHIVAPEVVDDLRDLAQAGHISFRSGHYQTADLEDMFLAVAATDDSVVNLQIAADASALGKMVCVADAPEIGSCSFPAVHHCGRLEIGVSTGGGCPALAIELRDLIATIISDEYETVANQLVEAREKLLTEGSPSTYNAQILRSLARRLISELNDRKDAQK